MMKNLTMRSREGVIGAQQATSYLYTTQAHGNTRYNDDGDSYPVSKGRSFMFAEGG
jgi:hypothetical protein